MKEYSIKFPVPAFTNYPRTVKTTVDWVAANAEVEKQEAQDFYVFGSDIPGPLDNSKVWAHYPNSSELPPIPGQNPNLPTPPPSIFYPSGTTFFGAFAPVSSSLEYDVFFDEATGYVWSFGNNSQPRARTSSGTVYTLPASGRNNRTFSMERTPNNKLFIAEVGGIGSDYSLSIYEIVNGAEIQRAFLNIGALPGSSARVCGLASDSSNNVYVVIANFYGGTTYKIYKMDGSTYAVTQLATTLPSPYTANFANSFVADIHTNSTGNLVGISQTPGSTTSFDMFSINPSTGICTILCSFTPGGTAAFRSTGIDSSNAIYFTTFNPSLHQVFKVSTSGVITAVIGTGVSGNVDGLLLSVQLNNPTGVFVSGTNFFVVDSGNGLLKTTTAPNPNAPSISNATYVSFLVNQASSFSIIASNSPTSYGATGLPSGMTVNSGTGVISGTPSSSGVYTVILSATNIYGTTTKGIIVEVFAFLPTNYYNLPTLRKQSAGSWNEFSDFQRGDILVIPQDQIILFPWGESGKSYDMSIWGESDFTVPVLPTPPSGFKYKYYIGARVSSASVGPILSP